MDLREDESNLEVTGCEDLNVEKRLDYSESTSHPEVHVSAEITQDGSLFTLWLTGEVEMYEYVKLASSCLYIYNIFLQHCSSILPSACQDSEETRCSLSDDHFEDGKGNPEATRLQY